MTNINTILKNRKNKKGFSLIELIVVLVIMAILAAALVPSLVGYIRQSRQNTAMNEAASCVSAAQTIVSSAYADPNGIYHNNTDATKDIEISGDAFTTAAATVEDVVETLAEVSGTIDDNSITISKGVVQQLKYTTANGTKVTYAVDATTGVGAYTVS